MTWHREILTLRQLRLLDRLGPLLARRGFYLAGGTAIALHLGHRRSVDLDWFTAEELPDPLDLARSLGESDRNFLTGQVAPGTLHGSIRGVRLTFLEYRYPLLAPLRPWRGGVHIAGRADLAAMKLAAAAQRGAKKDFVDIFALGCRSCPMRQMLRWYQKKYNIEDIAHVLYGLTYFDDADRERMPRMLWPATWLSVKETIRHWILRASW